MNQKELCISLLLQAKELKEEFFSKYPNPQTPILNSYKSYYDNFKSIVCTKFNLKDYSILNENEKISLLNLKGEYILSIILKTSELESSPKKYYKEIKIKTYSSTYNRGDEAILIGKIVEFTLKKENIIINKVNKSYYNSLLQLKKEIKVLTPQFKSTQKTLLRALKILNKIILKHISKSPSITFSNYDEHNTHLFPFFDHECFDVSKIEFSNIKNNTADVEITGKLTYKDDSPQGTWKLQIPDLNLFIKQVLIYNDYGHRIVNYSNIFAQ